MSRCATCGRETDERAGACAACETEAASSLAEALVPEVRCPSCGTWVPPASRFCGVCGRRLEAAPPAAGP